ncbi:hypothetical protein EAI6_40900 [Enterobacter asburiae]|nr:hypothetical protein EAI6_40900 [Enterobacter asburiae]
MENIQQWSADLRLTKGGRYQGPLADTGTCGSHPHGKLFVYQALVSLTYGTSRNAKLGGKIAP